MRTEVIDLANEWFFRLGVHIRDGRATYEAGVADEELAPAAPRSSGSGDGARSLCPADTIEERLSKVMNQRKTLSLRRVLSAALLMTGLALLLSAVWIPLKAVTGQILLHQAWQRTLAGSAVVKPWPWADTWPVARLELPTLGESFIVLAGASGESLAWAPGHLDGTAEPGDFGNSAISGHRDTHFSVLQDLSPADEIIVERRDGRKLRYIVREMKVVDYRDTSVLSSDTQLPTLTLITCYPFDAVVPGGPERYVVRAELLGELAAR